MHEQHLNEVLLLVLMFRHLEYVQLHHMYFQHQLYGMVLKQLVDEPC